MTLGLVFFLSSLLLVFTSWSDCQRTCFCYASLTTCRVSMFQPIQIKSPPPHIPGMTHIFRFLRPFCLFCFLPRYRCISYPLNIFIPSPNWQRYFRLLSWLHLDVYATHFIPTHLSCYRRIHRILVSVLQMWRNFIFPLLDSILFPVLIVLFFPSPPHFFFLLLHAYTYRS